MLIEKDTILYFSATGNSFQVAKDIGKELGGMQLCRITSSKLEGELQVKAKILGIVFPVYFARMPRMVEKVVSNLEISKDTYVFAVATFAASAGLVLEQVKNTLQGRGQNLNSGFLVSMPGNNVFSHGSFPVIIQARYFRNEKKKIKKISAAVSARKDVKCEHSKLLFDWGFTKSSYKFTEGFREKDRDFWANENCINCGLCVKVCPANNIEIKEGKPEWKHNCEQCAACIQHCPKEAIQYGKKTVGRKRYRNPNISIKELISY